MKRGSTKRKLNQQKAVPEEPAAENDVVTSNFLTCAVREDLTTEEQRKVVQSVELTKALVLMGFPTWSTLEPS